MIRPRRSRSMPLAARLVSRKVPVRFVSITDDQSSSDIRSNRVSAVMPAFATRTSTGPCAASASTNACSTAAASVTSQVRPRAPSGPPPEREVTATWSPRARNASAMARPMPRVPPVTRTERGSVTAPTLASFVLEPETDLHPDLEVLDVAVLDLPSDLRHLEPVDMSQGRAGAAYGVADGLVYAVGRRADDLGHAVGAVAHGSGLYGAIPTTDRAPNSDECQTATGEAFRHSSAPTGSGNPAGTTAILARPDGAIQPRSHLNSFGIRARRQLFVLRCTAAQLETVRFRVGGVGHHHRDVRQDHRGDHEDPGQPGRTEVAHGEHRDRQEAERPDAHRDDVALLARGDVSGDAGRRRRDADRVVRSALGTRHVPHPRS